MQPQIAHLCVISIVNSKYIYSTYLVQKKHRGGAVVLETTVAAEREDNITQKTYEGHTELIRNKGSPRSRVREVKTEKGISRRSVSFVGTFNLKKSATEAHRFLVEAYNETALSERTCREWFQKLKNGDFDVEDKDTNGRPKIYDDAELEELLEEDSSQTKKELALTLKVTQQAVSHRLKSLKIIHKQGNWVPYDLKPIDVQLRLYVSEMLLAQKRVFYIESSLVMKSGYIIVIKKKKIMGTTWSRVNVRSIPEYSWKTFGGVWWDLLGVIYY
ncbi:Mariner Mos1 transposase [Eumeta japonica]|uniref:Mariner Mos1 transposase n=1 Tax=Eumeta variegata TaxID=151549 RepID=A0A4C1Y5R0_EUMVA|nr:Mariner Mos1 transposase [Eumeta japonica]